MLGRVRQAIRASCRSIATASSAKHTLGHCRQGSRMFIPRLPATITRLAKLVLQAWGIAPILGFHQGEAQILARIRPAGAPGIHRPWWILRQSIQGWGGSWQGEVFSCWRDGNSFEIRSQAELHRHLLRGVCSSLEGAIIDSSISLRCAW